MAEPKTPTEKAMRFKREAYVERLCKDPPVLAPMWDREVAKALALPNPPDVGAGGEVVREQSTDRGLSRSYVRDTLKLGASQIAEDASIRRTDLLMQPSFEAVAMGIDAAESIQAENSLEKMLVHQMAVAHEMAMRFADRALSFEHKRAGDQVEACRCATTSARLMAAFQAGMLTLHKLRTGGNQTVTVQHVNVQPGAQAVIGNVRTGGAWRRGQQ
jgi:hypothetical protein